MSRKISMFSIIACVLIVITLYGRFYFEDNPKNQEPAMVTLAHDKGNMPVFQKNFLELGHMAQQQVGVGIKPVPSDSPDLFRHQMRATLNTKLAPDLFVWWSSFQAMELVNKNFAADMTEVWDHYQDDYSNDMREVFTINEKVYGFPYVVEYWPVWYNKTIFKRLGLEKPSTWEDFIHICEVLKTSGITPILLSLQLDWPAFIWFEEMIIGEDPNLYSDLCKGKVRYSDPRVIKACRVWKTMIEKGYFTDPSVNMLTNAGYLWSKETYGMVLCGSWYYNAALLPQGVDEDSIGAFILPSHNKAAGKNIIFEVGPMFIANHAPHPKATRDLVNWWMGPVGSGYFATLHKAYPGNIKTDISYLPPIKQALLSEINNEKYRLLNRYWEATPAPIGEMAVKKFGEFILNTNNLVPAMESIDRFADEYWEKNPL